MAFRLRMRTRGRPWEILARSFGRRMGVASRNDCPFDAMRLALSHRLSKGEQLTQEDVLDTPLSNKGGDYTRHERGPQP